MGSVGGAPTRPVIYFYDQEGNPIDPALLVDLTGDLEITEDGALSIQSEMEPLGELTISTHGRGELVSGSVRVVSDGPIGGVLRFDLPGIGVAGVGTSQPVRDAIFPARRQAGRISTAAAIHNLGEEAMVVSCQLMQKGAVLEEVEIPLEANGQEALYIEQMFTRTDTSDFVGSCAALRHQGGDVHRSGRGGGWWQSHLHHAAGGAGSREDASGIDGGECPESPVLASSRGEGGVLRRDEGGAQRFDAPAAEVGSAFRVLLS